MPRPSLDASTLYKMLEQAPGFITFLDPDLVIRYINKSGPTFTREQAIGRQVTELFPPEQVQRIRQAYELARTSRQEQEVEYYADSSDGTLRWYLMRVSTLWNDAGELIGWLNISTDATDQKQAEANLERVQADLLEASHRAGMAEVATGVLHNIGNVLSSVNVSASMLLEQVGMQHVEMLGRVVELCEDQGERLPEFIAHDPKGRKVPALLGRICQQLTAERDTMRAELARLAEHIAIVRATVDAQQSIARTGKLQETIHPHELIDRAISMFHIEVARKSIALSIDIQDRRPMRVDKQATLQILVNLIRNAIEAMLGVSGPRTLELRALSADDQVCFEIEDSGHGITEDNLTKIFRHGFTTKQGGHGFGLHASAIAASAMGGSLTVASGGPGRGARFRLCLPRGVAPR